VTTVLLVVAVLALPPAFWCWRILVDEVRFADAIGLFPSRPLLGRISRLASIVTHRRARRNGHRLVLVAIAAAATLRTSLGRWRALTWLAATTLLATTLHAIF
jgi:hypothetical protein